jgi:putative ABC transport system permease protein
VKSLLQAVLARLSAPWRRRDDAGLDLDDEIRGFLEQRILDYERRGLSACEARRAALREVGGVESVKEQVREARTGAGLRSLLRDARIGARVLWSAPAYALMVVLTIALGMGLNAAVFSVAHAVLWRPLPYPDAHRLVVVEADTRTAATGYDAGTGTLDIRERSGLITNMVQIEGRDASIEVDGVMEHVASARATDGAMDLLGAVPVHGRRLIAAQDLDGYTIRGVVISHALWQRRFGGDPNAVGQRISVNNFDARIVGILGKGFTAPLPASNHLADQVDVWIPRQFAPSLLFRGLVSVGRLAPGATVDQAQAELDAVMASSPDQTSAEKGRRRIAVRPLHEVIGRGVRPVLLALSVAVAFVHVIACVNVASLLLMRSKHRQRELAVRRALGATRARLVGQLLAENLVLAILGGACGLLLAHVGISVLESLRPVHLPRQSEIGLSVTTLLWTAALIAVSTVAFGLVPALAFTREQQDGALHASRAGSLQLRSAHLHRALMVTEVALSIVPLLAAGLMMRTVANLLDAPMGFDPTQVVTARVSLDLQEFDSKERRSAFYRDAIAAVRTLPFVDQVSIGGPPPLAPIQSTIRVWRGDDRDRSSRLVLQRSVMADYLAVMRIPLRAGRDIDDDDLRHGRHVAVIDERLAAGLWQGDAVGKMLTLEYSKTPMEIVGVAGAVRARDLRDDSTPLIYVPSHVYEIEQTLVARVRGPISAVGPAIKNTVEALGPGRPVFDVRWMDEVISLSVETSRYLMLLLTVFAAAALVLAGVGLYGTLGYLTAQRRQEFGVRIALGATAGGIVGLVLREGMLLAGTGAAVGLIAALVATTGLRGLLYGVTPLDGATLAGVTFTVGVAALAVVGWTAWRAACIEPAMALRGE